MVNEILAPAFTDADFCVICKGDSMINARIFDGDIVYIRQQDVKNGEIAAVLVGDEVHLGRLWIHPDCIMLRPENPAYASEVFYNEDGKPIIIGKGVAFISKIPDLEVSA